MSKPLSILLREFLEHLEIEKNRSDKTIQNYQFYIGRFVNWFGDKSPEDIVHEDIRQYRLWLNRLADAHGEPLKKNTQNYHLIALRSWLKYMARRDIKTLAAEKIELMKMPDREVSFLDPSDLNRLLEAPLLGDPSDSPDAILQRYRDKAALELLFSTGLRVSELINLKRDNVNLKRDEFTVTGKGRKSRVVFMSEQAKYWITKYLTARKDLNPYLFISHDKRRGKQAPSLGKEGPKAGRANAGPGSGKVSGGGGHDEPLTQRSMQRIVHKYAKAAGITKNVTPHTLRHSYATDLLQNGADIRSVQTMLGHSSITTTQIYTHITDRELLNIHKKFHGKKRDED